MRRMVRRVVSRSRRYLALSFPPPLTPVPPPSSPAPRSCPCALSAPPRTRAGLPTSSAFVAATRSSSVFAARSSSAFSAFFASFSALFCSPTQAPRDAEHERLAQEFRRRAQGLVLRHHRYRRPGSILRPPELTKGSASGGATADWYTASAHGDADAQAPERRVGLGRVLELLRRAWTPSSGPG